MNTSGSEIKIITGNANQELAAKIAEKVGVKLSDCIVTKFSDGEISVNINETVRGCDVFVVQSTNNPVNQYLMELLIMIDALKRASAGRITAVIPYYGYARQDRKAKSRDPITAKLVANLLTAAGADRVLTMDLHAAQIQGYFDIPVDHLLGQNLLANYFNKLGLEDITVVSPDLGSVTRSRKFANQLDGDVPLAIIDIILGVLFENQNIAFMVGLAFAIAASCNFPIILLSMYWSKLTTRGAMLGGWLGLITAVVLMILGPTIWVQILGHEKAIFPYEYPALFSISVAFLGIWLFSATDNSAEGARERELFRAQFIRSQTGFGVEQGRAH